MPSSDPFLNKHKLDLVLFIFFFSVNNDYYKKLDFKKVIFLTKKTIKFYKTRISGEYWKFFKNYQSFEKKFYALQPNNFFGRIIKKIFSNWKIVQYYFILFKEGRKPVRYFLFIYLFN